MIRKGISTSFWFGPAVDKSIVIKYRILFGRLTRMYCESLLQAANLVERRCRGTVDMVTRYKCALTGQVDPVYCFWNVARMALVIKAPLRSTIIIITAAIIR
jgi:hypothetical protein